MSQPTLTAVISANANGFTKTLGELQGKLRAFENGLQTAKGPESFARLQRAADATRQKIDFLKNSATQLNSAFKPTIQVSGQASQSLLNLGRIAQDAPFGFIGIANNINPLVESFQRLRASSGSTGATLKALGGSLVGAGGLGLAISAGTALLTLFGDNLFKSSKGVTALNDSIKESAKSLASEAANLTLLVGLAQNNAASTEDREKALKALNSEYKDYLKNLGIEKVDLKNINSVYEQIIDNLLSQAVIKGLQDEISASVEKTAKELVKLEVQQVKNTQASQQAATAAQKDSIARSNVSAQIERQGQATQDALAPMARYNAEMEFGINETDTYEGRVKLLKDALLRELAPLLTVTDKFKDLHKTLDDGSTKTVDWVSKAKELAEFLDRTTQFDVRFEANPTLSEKENTANAKEFIAKAQKFLKDQLPPFRFKQLVRAELEFTEVKPVSESVEDYLNSLKPKIRKSFDEVRADAQKNIEKLAIPVQVAIEARFKPFSRQQLLEMGGEVSINPKFDGMDFKERARAALADVNSEFIELVGSFQRNLYDAIGNGIGAALSGGGFGSLFKGIFSAIGTALQQLGQSLIAAAVGIQQLKALFKPPFNPVKALVGGIALVAIGGLIKSSFGNIAGLRATGGPVSAGKTYVVGERGPELFKSNLGGRIVPNSQMTGGGGFSMSPMPVNVSGEFRISGHDLVALVTSIVKTQKTTT